MNSKGIHEILLEATDEQVKEWWKAIGDEDRWPSTMPIPREAFQAVWHGLQKRVISIVEKKP
jgi:hypothetical protein